jgi:hypothetical protein
MIIVRSAETINNNNNNNNNKLTTVVVFVTAGVYIFIR